MECFGSQTCRTSAGTVVTFGLLLFMGFLLPHPVAAQVKEVRRVLILNEVGTSNPGINVINSGITSSLENSPYKLEFYHEYLDTTLFPDPADQQQIRASILAKYRNRKPDVIITVGPSPLRLMADTHEAFFPGVPVVFALPNAGAPGSPILDSHFAGVEDAIQAGGTVDLALRLQPGSQHLVVVGGTAAIDKQVEILVRQQLLPYEGRLDVSYLTNIDMPGLLQQLKHLPDHTVILFMSFSQDAAGTRFISASEAAPLIVGAANAPIFSLYDVYLNHGEVGGRVSSLLRDGEIAGRMAVRALNGERTQDISVTTSPTVDLFDWRALQRWELNENDLPAGSTVLYRQSTFWQVYRWYIIAGIALIALQTLLIFGLLWQKSRRREAEAEQRQAEQFVRESEERFRLAVQAGTMWAYEWDAATDKIVRSEEVNDILGQDEPRHTTGQHILSRIPPEDREQVIDAVARLSPANPFLRIRHRMTRSDGTVIWVARRSRAQFDEYGKMLRMRGMLTDVTDRVRAEETLRQKEKELSEAQRLARVGSWYWDAVNDRVTWSEELYRIFDRDSKLPALNYTDPSLFRAESWERLSRAREHALRDGTSYELDLEVIRPDGTTRTVRSRGEAVQDTLGHFVGLRGTVQDITERKLAEKALADLRRKLLRAQEQERTRIARELHDDISQQLALLSVEISRMEEALPDGKLRSQMKALEKQAGEISADIQSLSHELHSSKLEYLGLVSAMRSFCREFGDKHKVTVDFDSEGVPPGVAHEVALCLFRVMQEGLRNALKHSGVRSFKVNVFGSPTETWLSVQDSGVGFEPELARKSQGLGLVSMKERVGLVNGELSITSSPQSGTEVFVFVPLSAGTRTDQTKSAGA